MSLIESIQESIGLTSATQSNTSANAVSDLEQKGDLFSSFLSLTQGNSNSSDTASAAEDLSSAIDSIQQSLLSSLGLDGLSNDGLGTLTSEASLSSLQGNLLSSLQTSLFSSVGDSSNLNTQTTNSKIINEATNSDSLFSYIGSATTYTLGEDGLCADDVFDTVNILNHIPIVSDLYQKSTSTTVDPVSDIIGGFAYGGLIGLGFSAINLAVESWTGKSVFNNISDYILDDNNQDTLQTIEDNQAHTLQQTNKAYDFVSRSF